MKMMQAFKQINKEENKEEKFITNRLIVDLNNLIYKSIYVHKSLYSKGKIFTGGFYGVLSQIESAIKTYKILQVIICDDYPPYLRAGVLEYKEGREKRQVEIKDKLIETRKLCTEFFNILNVNIWKIKGLEADDLIATLVQERNAFLKNYILSNDSDLFQILRDHVFLIKNRQKLYGASDFYRATNGLSPSKWPWVLALSGGHNGLPGFKGIGEKKALEIVQNEKELLQFIRKNPVALTYYYLSKLPLFNLKETPNVLRPTEKSIKVASKFLKRLDFKGVE